MNNNVEVLLDRLEQVKKTGSDTWRCKCPCGHNSPSQMAVKETPQGLILIHCYAGHSPAEIMAAIDLSVSDLFEKDPTEHIRPLYMVRQENRKQADIKQQEESCELRLHIAQEARDRGEKLSKTDLKTERDSYLKLRQLRGVMA